MTSDQAVFFLYLIFLFRIFYALIYLTALMEFSISQFTCEDMCEDSVVYHTIYGFKAELPHAIYACVLQATF